MSDENDNSAIRLALIPVVPDRVKLGVTFALCAGPRRDGDSNDRGRRPAADKYSHRIMARVSGDSVSRRPFHDSDIVRRIRLALHASSGARQKLTKNNNQ